jgi:DTW domain-containing protein YfiP
MQEKISKLLRKRKTKDPCLGCYLHKEICICALIPTLDLKTKITLVVHAKELKRTTNTGRLALKALVNSEMLVRGESREALDLSNLLSPQYRSLLFYPSEDAVELTREFVTMSELPIQLIVPDGNWRQASKVHIRHKELASIPRVKISTRNENPLHMRLETTEEGMATLEAIAQALTIIEGTETGNALMQVYKMKLERTLKARGILI